MAGTDHPTTQQRSCTCLEIFEKRENMATCHPSPSISVEKKPYELEKSIPHNIKHPPLEARVGFGVGSIYSLWLLDWFCVQDSHHSSTKIQIVPIDFWVRIGPESRSFQIPEVNF